MVSLKVPFIDLTAQYAQVKPKLWPALEAIFTSQQFVLKDHVTGLEQAIVKDMGAKYALGLNSGTDALFLSLMAAGISKGDEVITTPFTFFATAASIARVGATPVFVDVEPDTYNLDWRKIEAKITPRTKAIIPVHLFGLMCDMKPILEIAKRRSLLVIEDIAQAYGASYNGQRSGSMGDISCLSFFPTKNLGGAGDGGMVVTNSQSLYEKIKILRVHGAHEKDRYIHEIIGINSRLDEIQAAVVRAKLPFLESWNKKRALNAAVYNEAFADLPLKTPVTPKGHTHIFHLYTLRSKKRDALAKVLGENGVGSGVYYPLPLHLQPCFKELGYRKGDMPVAEELAGEVLSLPMYAELSDEHINFVIESVRNFF